jgi:hypothetical protein
MGKIVCHRKTRVDSAKTIKIGISSSVVTIVPSVRLLGHHALCDALAPVLSH